MQGGEKARREEGKSSVRACFPNVAAQRAGAAPSGGSPGRFASAKDSSEPGSLSGLGLPRSLPATCSPPLSLPASQPAGARAPAPPHLLELSLGEGNGNPLQYSCLEKLMGRGAWWAAVHGVGRVGHD